MVENAATIESNTTGVETTIENPGTSKAVLRRDLPGDLQIKEGDSQAPVPYMNSRFFNTGSESVTPSNSSAEKESKQPKVDFARYKEQVKQSFERLKNTTTLKVASVLLAGAVLTGCGADAIARTSSPDVQTQKPAATAYVPMSLRETATASIPLATATPLPATEAPAAATTQPAPEAPTSTTTEINNNATTQEKEKVPYNNEFYKDEYRLRSEAGGDVEIFKREINGGVIYYTVADIGPDSSVEPEIINSDNARPIMKPDGQVVWEDQEFHDREQDKEILKYEERTGKQVYAATNGSFAAGATNAPSGTTINDGEFYDGVPISSWTNALVTTKDGDIKIGIFSKDELQQIGADTVIGVNPPVIRDGQAIEFEYQEPDSEKHDNPDKAIMRKSDATEAKNQLTNVRPKTWIGKRRDGKLVLVVSKKVSGNDLAQTMISADIVDMAPLDGGKSPDLFVHRTEEARNLNVGTEIQELTGNRDENHTLRDIPNSIGLVSKKPLK